MTTTEIAQLLARIDTLERHVMARLAAIEQDLEAVRVRELRAQIRAELEAELRAPLGSIDGVTDPGFVPLPLPVNTGPRPLPAVPDITEEPTDPINGLLSTARQNFRFSVMALVIIVGLIFGGGPQVVEALALLGWLPRAPMQVELTDVPAPVARPLPGGMSTVTAEPLP